MVKYSNERKSVLMMVGLCLLLTLLGSCRTNKQEMSTALTPTLPDPHHHVVDVNQTSLDSQTVSEFQIVEVVIESDLERESITLNQDGTFEAFAMCDQTCRLFVEDTAEDWTVEIQGLPLPWRPFSDLVWVTNDILVFDRWSNPQYGIHYAVNIRDRKIILASPFPDQLPVPESPTETSGIGD